MNSLDLALMAEPPVAHLLGLVEKVPNQSLRAPIPSGRGNLVIDKDRILNNFKFSHKSLQNTLPKLSYRD